MKIFMTVLSVIIITLVICFLIAHAAITSVIAAELNKEYGGSISEAQYDAIWNQYVLSNGGYLTILFKKSAGSAYASLVVFALGCLLAVGFALGRLTKLTGSINPSDGLLVKSNPDDKILLITKLGALRETGAISHEEFEEQKSKILSR